MKPQLFRLEPPFVTHRLGVARPGAIEPEVLRQIEEEGQVRRERIRCPTVERAQFVEIDEPSESLIGERGVGEAVAEDGGPALQRRPDDLDDVLSSRRRKKKQLSDGIEMRAAVQQDGPYPIGQRRSAWLLRHNSAGDALGQTT